MNSLVKLSLLCSAAVLAVSVVVTADKSTENDEATGTLAGIVHDKQGSPIIGAVIRIKGTKKGAAARPPHGNFRIPNVVEATYNVEITAAGKELYTTTAVIVADSTTFLNVVLQEGGFDSDVEIVIGPRIVESEKLGTTKVLSSGEMQARPVESVAAIVNQQDGSAHTGSSFRIRGSRAEHTSVQVDGVDVGDDFTGSTFGCGADLPTVSVAATANVQVVTGGQEATAQEAVGGVVRPHQDYTTQQLAKPAISTEKQRFSTFSIDVDGAAYAMLRSRLERGYKPMPSGVRIEEMINYFDYNYATPTGDEAFKVNAQLMESEWDEEKEILRVGIQGKEVAVADAPDANIVFLIDVSGSMHGAKLHMVKESIRLLAKNIRKQDRIAMVTYAGNTKVVLPSTPGSNVVEILRAVDQLESGGGTNGAGGIHLAYEQAEKNFVEDGNNRVVLITDGDFNLGVSSTQGLKNLIEEKRESGVFLTVVGTMSGYYADERMEEISNHGNGNYSMVDGIQEARKALAKEFTGTMITIAKDVKIQVEFNPFLVESYRLIGYDNRMLNKEDFENDKVDAGDIGAGHTVTALYEIVRRKSAVDYSALDDVPDFGENVAIVRVRYKEPDGETSSLVEGFVDDDKRNVDADAAFAQCVAEFGLLCRGEIEETEGQLDNIITRAKAALGNDDGGYRSEFIQLVKTYRDMFSVAQN